MKMRSTLAITTLAAVIALAGCNKTADTPAAKADAGKIAAATDAKKIAGLPTEKDQISYMVGMDMAKLLEPAKTEVDIDTTIKAMRDVLDGKKVLLTEEQANQIRETFESALSLGREALIRMDVADEEADDVIGTMRRRDAERFALEASQGMEAGRRLLLSHREDWLSAHPVEREG